MISNNRHTRQRIPIACRRCNVKKIKCDATEGSPCSGCRLKGMECILIESRRGKYTRNRSRFYHSPAAEPTTEPRRDAGRKEEAATISRNEDNVTSTRAPPAATPPPEEESLPAAGARGGHGEQLPRDTAREPALFAQVAEQRIAPHLQHPITGSERTLFLGEAFSLTYVVNDVLAPFLGSESPLQKRRLHLPVPEQMHLALHRRDKRSLVLEQTKWLQEHGLYNPLPWSQKKRLLDVYFEWFHPAFPMFDRAEWTGRAERGEASLLVENALLMVAVTICSHEELRALGSPDRYSTRSVFYKQARSLYDSDLDIDKLDLIAGTFLLSFWWGEPDDPKDSWYWLAITTSLAQGLGLHRSTKYSEAYPQVTRKWKRIWWSIRMREALVSGSIGRPQHVNELDCDIEMLEPDDVEGEDVEVYYACQMARLCQILTRVINSRYASVPPKHTSDLSTLETALLEFRRNIPDILQYSQVEVGSSSKQTLWAAMLMMAYDYTTMLLCRPSQIDSGGPGPATKIGNIAQAQQAANEATRIMEDLLTERLSRVCQIHTIPALFNSLAMHLLALCNSTSTGRALAENRARMCMLGLNALQVSWPVGSWVFLMFKTIMEGLRKRQAAQRPGPLAPFTPHDTSSSGPEVNPITGCGSSSPPRRQGNPHTPDSSYIHPTMCEMPGSSSGEQDQQPMMGMEGMWTDDLAILQTLFDLDTCDDLWQDLAGGFESLDLPVWDEHC